MRCKSFAKTDSTQVDDVVIEHRTHYDYVFDGKNKVLKPLPSEEEILTKCRVEDYNLTSLVNLGLADKLPQLGGVDGDPLSVSDQIENLANAYANDPE